MDVEASGQVPAIEELDFFSDWYPNPSNFCISSPGSFVIDSYSDSDCSDPFLDVGGDVADLGALTDGSLETLSEADVRDEVAAQSSGEEVQFGGLRLVGIDSDSDSDYLDSEDPNSFDSDSRRNGIEEFELDEPLFQDDRDVNLEEVITASDNLSDEAEDPEIPNFEWEFLLEIINSRRDLVVDFDPYMVNQDEYVSTTEPDRFVEATIKGSPPAAKTVVENLPLISISEDELQKNGGVCAVCKDEVPVGETVKMLPCLHYYHGECILPWLEIRNSCPVCRFELPTDDVEYERSRTQSAEGGSLSWDPQVRLEFESFTD